MIYKWGDLISLEYGKPVKDKAKTDGKYPVYGTNGQIGTSDLPPLCNHASFILGRKGAYRGVHYSSTPFSVIDTAFYAENLYPELLDIKWAYYKFLTYDINSMDSGSAIPSTDRYEIYALEVDLPDIRVQEKQVQLLECFDDKILNLRQINDNLQQQAQALYKAWFVDFSAFGGTAPDDWQTYHLVDFLPVITGKKNANVSSDQGQYPFFSCSQDYAWTNDYSFDGSAILVAGNGDFNVKFYSGKFEAYQRTYVLIPYEPKYTAWLFYAVQYHLSSITSAARGSVIKFITKGNLENFEFVAPQDPLSLPVVHTLDTINRKIAANREEIIKLGNLRDTLLPRLMSGKIDVSDIQL